MTRRELLAAAVSPAIAAATPVVAATPPLLPIVYIGEDRQYRTFYGSLKRATDIWHDPMPMEDDLSVWWHGQRRIAVAYQSAGSTVVHVHSVMRPAWGCQPPPPEMQAAITQLLRAQRRTITEVRFY